MGPCETCIHEVWVVGASWDHGAMSHGCQGVEGVGVMGWSGRSGRRGGESGEGGAGGHALGPFKVIKGHWVVGASWDHGAMSHGCQGVEGVGVMGWVFTSASPAQSWGRRIHTWVPHISKHGN